MKNAPIQITIAGRVVNLTSADVARFFKYVDRRDPNECWHWLGSFSHGRYGNFVVGNKNLTAHRVAFAIVNGDIPAGLLCCHKCDNMKCCNPSHIFLGTYQDNTDDRQAKNRGFKPIGEKNNRAIITSEIAAQIRAQFIPRKVSVTVLANRFGIGRTTVFHILAGHTWKT